MLMIFVILSK